jgi:hypothetical protein
MAQLTPIEILTAGVVPTYAAANAEDKVKQPTDQRIFLHVKNGGVGSINVTIPAQQSVIRDPSGGNITLSDIVVAVANGAEKMIGPFPPAYVDDAGDVVIQYSGTTSVTAKAFTLPRTG